MPAQLATESSSFEYSLCCALLLKSDVATVRGSNECRVSRLHDTRILDGRFPRLKGNHLKVTRSSKLLECKHDIGILGGELPKHKLDSEKLNT